MSVANELYLVETIGDGSTPAIAFNRKVFDSTHVRCVSVTGGTTTVLTNGVDFNVTGAGDTSTGATITPTAPILTGTTWYTFTDQGPTQGQVYSNGAQFPAKSHEYSLDKLAIAIQEVQGLVENPSGFYPESRASTFWTYDENGVFELVDISLLNLGGSAADRIVVDSSTARLCIATDAYKIVEMTNAGANTVTLQTDAAADFPIGGYFDVVQIGAGLTTIVQGAGATVVGDLISQGQYKAMSIYKRAANTWVVTGGTV